MPIDFNNPKTKDLIIFILIKNPGLTAKEIYENLKSEKWNFSYQSVHKILKELLNQKVIIKSKNKYIISNDWLDNLRKLIDMPKQKKQKIEKIGNYTIHTFENISELDSFIFEFTKNIDKKLNTDDIVYWEAKHYWWPIAYSKEMYDITMARENKHISKKVFLSDTNLDKWCASYYKKLGVNIEFKKIKNGKDNNFNTKYFAVYKNIKLEIILSDMIKNRLDNFFLKIEKFTDIDLKRFYKNIINKKSKVKLVISTDDAKRF